MFDIVIILPVSNKNKNLFIKGNKMNKKGTRPLPQTDQPRPAPPPPPPPPPKYALPHHNIKPIVEALINKLKDPEEREPIDKPPTSRPKYLIDENISLKEPLDSKIDRKLDIIIEKLKTQNGFLEELINTIGNISSSSTEPTFRRFFNRSE